MAHAVHVRCGSRLLDQVCVEGVDHEVLFELVRQLFVHLSGVEYRSDEEECLLKLDPLFKYITDKLKRC